MTKLHDCTRCGKQTKKQPCQECRDLHYKKCSWCGAIKETKDFKARKDTKSGYCSYCKDCYNAYQRKQRALKKQRKGTTKQNYMRIIEGLNMELLDELDHQKRLVQEQDLLISRLHLALNRARKIINESQPSHEIH